MLLRVLIHTRYRHLYCVHILKHTLSYVHNFLFTYSPVCVCVILPTTIRYVRSDPYIVHVAAYTFVTIYNSVCTHKPPRMYVQFGKRLNKLICKFILQLFSPPFLFFRSFLYRLTSGLRANSIRRMIYVRIS